MLYHSAKVQLADTEPSILGITSCETTHPTIALQWRHRAPPCHHATGRYRSTQSSRPIFAASTQVRGRGRSFTYNELLNELDVRASLLRQVVVRLGVRRGLVPPLEFLVLKQTAVSANHFLHGGRRSYLQQPRIAQADQDRLGRSPSPGRWPGPCMRRQPGNSVSFAALFELTDDRYRP